MRDFSRNTKIVATVGPSSANRQVLQKMIEEGVDVFRLNFSHGSHRDHSECYHSIRDLEADSGRKIGILQDLQGPKFRIGQTGNAMVEVQSGQSYTFVLDDILADHARASLPHPEIYEAVQTGTVLLIDDGRLRFRVTDRGSDFVDTEVEVGGKLSSNKGVNIPNVVIPISPLTQKDYEDLELGLKLGVDWVALSFVQRPDDLEVARELIGNQAGLMAKIEKPSALVHLEDIVAASDGIMVARGDLGVELPVEDVPGLQKDIVKVCRSTGTPVVVATQMLESMIQSPSPTRAEVSDVATAVFDGVDAVMLSAESAVGKYPVESVNTMAKIIRQTEQHSSYRTILESVRTPDTDDIGDVVSKAACQVSEAVGAKALVCYTTTGSTGLRAAQARPDVPIVLLTSSMSTAGRLTLTWGCQTVVTDDVDSFESMLESARLQVLKTGACVRSDIIVITAGVPFGSPGATNNMRVVSV